jgi:hypothetical protein
MPASENLRTNGLMHRSKKLYSITPASGPIFYEPLARSALWDVGDRFGLSGFIQ